MPSLYKGVGTHLQALCDFMFQHVRHFLSTHRNMIVCAALAAGLLFAITFRTWVHEDANITFRVVDNALHGYGLRWNIDERVQVYTHPLWLMLLIPTTFVFSFLPMLQALYTAALVLSAGAIALLLGMTGFHFRRHPHWFLFFILLPFSCSLPFLDYATSGLENPLGYVLIGLLLHQFMADKAQPDWFLRSLFYSLLLLTRLDLALLFAPAFAITLWPHRKALPVKPLLLGTLPLAGWWLFSLIYYGFIFANSYYAKVSSSFPLSTYIKHGGYYLADLAAFSPATALWLFGSCLLSLLLCLKEGRSHALFFSMGTGALLYSTYIISIGGDYMTGRLFSYPFCLMSLALAYHAKAHAGTYHYIASVLMVFAALYSWFIQPSPPIHPTGNRDIYNERSLRRATCYFCSDRSIIENDEWPMTGKKHAYRAKLLQNEQPDQHYVAIEGSVGLIGLFAGPQVIIIDPLRITDPFLARLPVAGRFRIGHFETIPPHGYLETRRTGDIQKMDPHFRAAYTALRRVTAGPVWSKERFRAIVAFHTGRIRGL